MVSPKSAVRAGAVRYFYFVIAAPAEGGGKRSAAFVATPALHVGRDKRQFGGGQREGNAACFPAGILVSTDEIGLLFQFRKLKAISCFIGQYVHTTKRGGGGGINLCTLFCLSMLRMISYTGLMLSTNEELLTLIQPLAGCLRAHLTLEPCR